MLKRLRNIFVNAPFTAKQNLAGRKFIVTGASPNSLGYATAKLLLQWGAEVTISQRTDSSTALTQLLAEIPSATDRLFAHDLDLSQAQSTSAFADWYISERKELDVLINNAGIHLDLLSKWTQPKLSEDGYELQWRTNYLGTAHLTHSLLPLLKSSAEGGGDARIVNVVSMLHSKGSNTEFFNPVTPYNSWNAYGQSKLGLVHFTMECQRRYQADGLQAYCLHPGSVYTNVAGKGLAGNPLIEAIRNRLGFIERFFLLTAEEGAQTQMHCATNPNAEGGKYYRSCQPTDPCEEATDETVSARLWENTLEDIQKL